MKSSEPQERKNPQESILRFYVRIQKGLQECKNNLAFRENNPGMIYKKNGKNACILAKLLC
jgi:hypothetical protein